jgi:cytidylate kinase
MASSGELGGLPAWTAKGTDLPLEGESRVQVRGWDQVAVDDSDRFTADLQTLGLRQHEVDHGAQILQSVNDAASGAVKSFWDRQSLTDAPAHDDLVAEAGQIHAFIRDNALTRLKDWLAGRRIVVDSRDLVSVRVPLFVLAAYSTPGCVSTYKTTTDQSRKLGWSVTICGTGLSGDATVTSSVSSTLTAQAGQACLVFLQVTVAVEQVHVAAKDGTTLGSGQRVNVSPAAQQQSAPGGLLLDSGALPTPGPSVETYPLSGYAAGVPAEYEYVYTQQRAAQLQLGVKAAGADVSLTGAVSMSASVTLDFTLIGGRDYNLCRTTDADGLVWS